MSSQFTKTSPFTKYVAEYLNSTPVTNSALQDWTDSTELATTVVLSLEQEITNAELNTNNNNFVFFKAVLFYKSVHDPTNLTKIHHYLLSFQGFFIFGEI